MSKKMTEENRRLRSSLHLAIGQLAETVEYLNKYHPGIRVKMDEFCDTSYVLQQLKEDEDVYEHEV